MIMKIYLVFIKYKGDDPEIEIHTDLGSAIAETRNRLYNQSNQKSRIREFEVTEIPYLGINLAESMMAWIEPRDVFVPEPEPTFATSSVPVYSMQIPFDK